MRQRRLLPLGVATAILLLLLFAFQSVVHGIVRDGEARRVAAAEHASGVWRCYGAQGRRTREACLQALEGPAVGAAPGAP